MLHSSHQETFTSRTEHHNHFTSHRIGTSADVLHSHLFFTCRNHHFIKRRRDGNGPSATREKRWRSTPASGSDSGQSTKGPADAKKRELRASTSRMQQMQYFFDQMRAISAERVARREELEKEKEKRRAERRAERIQERQERRKMHEDKLQLIREALGFKQ
ncbi:hypothetical protein HPB48_011359 [Haemaphysalis longicornis]|uniref:Uncharacterized protein n=1 Tax=Haemaphysalis longicornis TaxID=44386 RepID=A0A9J6FX65_HAELO|nr:hypothetical protein HPB48_011359 [Haemaphysalis longicornis]